VFEGYPRRVLWETAIDRAAPRIFTVARQAKRRVCRAKEKWSPARSRAAITFTVMRQVAWDRTRPEARSATDVVRDRPDFRPDSRAMNPAIPPPKSRSVDRCYALRQSRTSCCACSWSPPNATVMSVCRSVIRRCPGAPGCRPGTQQLTSGTQPRRKRARNAGIPA